MGIFSWLGGNMDIRTGEVMDKEDLRKKLGGDFDKYAVPVDEQFLSSKRKRELAMFGRTRIGRNEKCPCGSGKKFKRCCVVKVNR